MTYFDETRLHTINILQLEVMWHSVNSRRKVCCALVHLGMCPYLLQPDRLHYCIERWRSSRCLVKTTQNLWNGPQSVFGSWLHMVSVANLTSLWGVFRFSRLYNYLLGMYVPEMLHNPCFLSSWVHHLATTIENEKLWKWRRFEIKFILSAATWKTPNNPQLKLCRVHLGGSVSKISALPRHQDHPMQGSVFNWTGRGRRGEPGDVQRGGWGRIYDLSIFPPLFFLAEKQDCWLSACRDEWSSYKLVNLKDNVGSFRVAWSWHSSSEGCKLLVVNLCGWKQIDPFWWLL